MRIKASIVLMSFLLLGAADCSPAKRADFLTTTHEGLAISQVTYKRVLEAFAEAQIQGVVTDEQMENVMRIATGYQNTHNLVVTLTQEYAMLTDPNEKQALASRIISLTQNLDGIITEIITLLGTYGVEVA